MKRLLTVLSESLHGEMVYKTASEIWQNDRWFNFSSFSKTADYCAERLRRAGLVVEVLEVPADGRTRFGDWVMPKAWDVDDASLTLVEPKEFGRALARYREIPQSLFMYSAPTPEEGIETEVVYVKDADKPEAYEDLDLKGRIVLTEKPGPTVERHASDHGAVGIISFKYPGHGIKAPPDSIAWENACFLPENADSLFGFSLSPEKGLWLKNLISDLAAKGVKVRARAIVRTKLYDGAFKVVSALVPGVAGEEVWALGHLYEPGANDNASGCAAMMEAAEGIKKLIDEEKLPKPRRGLRFIFTFECYGTMAYMLTHKGIESRVVAGIDPDMVGGDQEKSKSVLMLSENPHVTLSFTDAIATRLMMNIFGDGAYPIRWRSSGFVLDDNLIADPCFGVPTPAVVGLPDRFWHSSKDTPEILDKGLLVKASCLVAAYMLTIAYASCEDAFCLLEETYRAVESKILRETNRMVVTIYSLKESNEDRRANGLAELLEETQGKILYWREIGSRALESVLRLVSARDEVAELRQAIETYKDKLDHRMREQEEAIASLVKRLMKAKRLERSIPEPGEEERLAAKIVPERLIVGTLTFKGLPRDLQRKSRWKPAYSSRLNIPLFWIDGKRSLLQIHRALRNEVGTFDLKELVDYFHFLEMAGYVKLEEP